MSREHDRERLSELMDGRLDAAEAERVRRMAAEDPELAAELAELERLCELFRAVPAEDVPPGLSDDIMARVRAADAPLTQSLGAPEGAGRLLLARWGWGAVGAAAAAVLVVVLLQASGPAADVPTVAEGEARLDYVDAVEDDLSGADRETSVSAPPESAADAKRFSGPKDVGEPRRRTRGGAHEPEAEPTVAELERDEVLDEVDGGDAQPAPPRATRPTAPAKLGADDSVAVERLREDEDALAWGRVVFPSTAAADRYLTLLRARETVLRSEERKSDAETAAEARRGRTAKKVDGASDTADAEPAVGGVRDSGGGAGSEAQAAEGREIEVRLPEEVVRALALRAGGRLVVLADQEDEADTAPGRAAAPPAPSAPATGSSAPATEAPTATEAARAGGGTPQIRRFRLLLVVETPETAPPAGEKTR